MYGAKGDKKQKSNQLSSGGSVATARPATSWSSQQDSPTGSLYIFDIKTPPYNDYSTTDPYYCNKREFHLISETTYDGRLDFE